MVRTRRERIATRGVLAISVLAILYITLFPFDFAPGRASLLSSALSGASWDSGIRLDQDLVLNVLLFVGFGFGLGALSCRGGSGGWWGGGLTLSASFLLSLSIEVLQLTLTDRNTAVADLVANTAGGALGFALMWWSRRRLSHLLAALSSGRFRLLVASCVLVLWAPALWLRSTSRDLAHLTNWDPSYPLVLGNERTGDRPWRGTMSALGLASRSFTDLEARRVLATMVGGKERPPPWDASYVFARGLGAAQAGQPLPPLGWHGDGPGALDARGVHLEAMHWLATRAPVRGLVDRIRRSGQFTVGLRVQSMSPEQTGPARIVSISLDPFLRDLTIAQDGTAMSLRVRTLGTGPNGTVPELLVPEVFAESRPRASVVRYDGSRLHVLLDGSSEELEYDLSSRTTALWRLRPVEAHRVRMDASSDAVLGALLDVWTLLPLLGLVLVAVQGVRQSRT